ncbi:uncharacterized protein LOC111782556 isoform X1 [Cucurbita pepo subsp. pepo]|uniref:uncharacterized protein LOC111782556 isoform X1 n=1 Tax=Cucurbita pepo subsp. pepo TaxID=3664 RepID=UPI000C9D7C90|nr:uncharacterized protein LOC111782556 isoform X1 [Cucurbita pepo subsp. pepo]
MFPQCFSFNSLFPWISLLFFFFIFFLLNIASTASLIDHWNSDTEALYDQHCNQIVPKSPLDTDPSSFPSATSMLQLRNSYFTGGDKIITQPRRLDSFFSRHVFVYALHAQKTVSPGVVKLQASLVLRGSMMYLNSFDNYKHRRLRLIRYRGPRTHPWKPRVGFALEGFWSETSGKVCMVGSGTSLMNSGVLQNLNVILKLDCPTNVTISNSLITGTLESLNHNSGPQFFEPVSILSLAESPEYKYTLIDKGIEGGCLSGNDRGLKLSQNVCSVFRTLTDTFDLEYESDCDDMNCNPLGKNVKYLPVSMNYEGVECTHEGKMLILLRFANSSYRVNRYSFIPSDTLIAEGMWDQEESQLCAVACRIMNYTQSLTNASIGGCSIRLSLRFPAVFSIRNRSTIEGQIWSSKSANESGYFQKIGFRSYNAMLIDPSRIKYEYTEVGTQSSCPRSKNVYGKEKTYPSENSSDMRFDLSLKNSEDQIARGYASPFFYGQHFYQNDVNSSLSGQRESAVPMPSYNGLLNISYRISFRADNDFKIAGQNFSSKKVEISAEGLYDKNTGSLCMTGCWQRELMKKRTLDCEIVVKVQFPPLDASGMDGFEGTIESKRPKSDPFYFDNLVLSSVSIYDNQAEESIWRMDLEITMVLVSNTFACLFVVLQLLYVNKHPEVLPFVSVLMVVIMCLGHMIPLLLNFEALFAANRNQQSVFLGSGGWLEVNEVIVRVVTMVAFLLQLRLLQLTWSSRQDNTSEKDLWDSEIKLTYLTLPLYALGILIAWLVYKWKDSSSYMPFLQPRHAQYRSYPTRKLPYQQNSFWEILKSLGGLVLDGFLIPQIIFNLMLDSKERALAFSFYMGTTLVRLLPHAYDLYRAHHSSWYLDLSYIYANHKQDFYSTAWDIIIPSSVLVLALIIFLQQRFGGRCMLPRVLRKQGPSYDQLPTISNEEL